VLSARGRLGGSASDRRGECIRRLEIHQLAPRMGESLARARLEDSASDRRGVCIRCPREEYPWVRWREELWARGHLEGNASGRHAGYIRRLETHQSAPRRVESLVPAHREDSASGLHEVCIRLPQEEYP